jgi:hypothetical protein
MRNKLVMAAAFAALVAGCGTASSSAQPVVQTQRATSADAARVSETAAATAACDVRVERSAHGVLLRGVAHARVAEYGDFSFVVTKSGRGGSSDISQGGAYALTPGAETVLGSADLSMERGASWRAVIVLEKSGVEICRRDVRS